MYSLITIIYLLSIIHINGAKSVPFFNDKTYNPCKSQAGLYYYPHLTNVHLYYQCDEPGNAYLRSCGDLVWDKLRLACNWPTAAILSSSQGKPIAAAANSSSTNTTTSGPTSISSLPDTTSPQSSTTSPSSATTVITELSSTTDSPSLSLCKPVNPCGAHGDCIESPITVPSSTRRFACICSENWFGRLCDKQIDDLTTPTTMKSDQDRSLPATNDTFSLPAKTEKDSKLIFYGLKAGNTVPAFNETEKPINP